MTEERYLRQLRLLGREGQEKLRGATVLVAGLGGLGSPVTLYLSAAGIGKLFLVDEGRLELSNLNRQVLYSVNDVGKFKALVAAERVRSLNPDVEVEPYVMNVQDERFEELVRRADVVVDCLDNWAGRLTLDKLTWIYSKPLVHGGIAEFYGQVTTVLKGVTHCLKCVLGITSGHRGEPPQVLGPTPGVIGAIQAAEVIKLVAGIGEPLFNKLLIMDLKRGEFTTLEVRGNPECECW